MRLRRRDALLAAGAACLTGSGAPAPGAMPVAMPGAMMGADAALGHRLRTGGFPEPTATGRAEVVIVGGGIAGLSAAWWLRRLGVDGVTLVEMERDVGGNASSGRNAVSAYPWGAHYVPLLTDESVHAAALFEELGIITGRDAAGRPVYDEYALCADPRERLFRYGRWQEDLLPETGVSDDDRRQYRDFFARMDAYRGARGEDGRKAFAIPLELSSQDERFRALDRISMAAFVRDHGWDSEPLLWYIEYCCRDDYGTNPDQVSAWAGVHYFASRDGKAGGDSRSLRAGGDSRSLPANGDDGSLRAGGDDGSLRAGGDDGTQSVLAWPEGNGHIVAGMKTLLDPAITAALAWRVVPTDGGVAVDVYEPAHDATRRIEARAAILAVPHFVADRLLGRAGEPSHSYAPWMVANVTIGRMPQGRGAPLCWDNVVYNSRSLGYVVATHQSLEQAPWRTVLTYYWPLSDASPPDARRSALARPLAAWQAQVTDELLRVHPELDGAIERVDVWLWGHGMIRPTPGYLFGAARAAACVQTPPVFFAHSDMSGISIFEEANYRGVVAANAVQAFLT